MSSNAHILRKIVSGTVPILERINEFSSKQKTHPDKWSNIEVLGHLIDSAFINQYRFIQSQFKDDLLFEGYDQVACVKNQGYQSRNWFGLIQLWKDINNYVADSIDKIPPDIIIRNRNLHNLNEIAFQSLNKESSATLDYLIKDYIAHLEHHIQQILPDYKPTMIGNY